MNTQRHAPSYKKSSTLLYKHNYAIFIFILHYPKDFDRQTT